MVHDVAVEGPLVGVVGHELDLKALAGMDRNDILGQLRGLPHRVAISGGEDEGSDDVNPAPEGARRTLHVHCRMLRVTSGV